MRIITGMERPIRTVFLFCALLISSETVAQQSDVLTLQAHIPLEDVTGRMDHLSVDVKGERLFVAAVDNHTLEVINLKLGKRIHTIADLPEPQGVYYDPSANHLFVARAL